MTFIYGNVNIGYLSRYDAFLWWRHQTDFFRVTAPLKGIFLSPLDFHNKEPIMRAFFYINLNKWFNKQPMLPLAMALMWRPCNGNAVYNLSHKNRNYLFNMILLPMRECWCLFWLARKTLEQTADRAVILDPLLFSYIWQNCVDVVS